MAALLNHKIVYTVSAPLPAISVPFVKPISYDFRVVEWMKDGKVSKVTLQVQTWEHDEYGVGIVVETWKDVERVQFPLP